MGLLNDTHKSLLLNEYEKLGGQQYAEQLESERSVFLKRFSPEALSRLNGSDLLSAIHDRHNDESLYHWLFSKIADDFDSWNFGRLLHRYDYLPDEWLNQLGLEHEYDSLRWIRIDKSGTVQEISIEQAAQIATNYRHQLLQCVELLDKVPEYSGDQVYMDLQSRLNEEAPDICHMGWVHKYLSLLFPEKLSIFHNEWHQRFHLLKALQIPADSSGLYATEGRFVALAKETKWPLSLFVSALMHSQGEPHRYWQIDLSHRTEGVESLEEIFNNGILHVPASNHEIRKRDFILISNENTEKAIFHVNHVCRCCNGLEVGPMMLDEFAILSGDNALRGYSSLEGQTSVIVEFERHLQEQNPGSIKPF